MTARADAHQWETNYRLIDGVAFCDFVGDPSPLPLALKQAFDKPFQSQTHGWPRHGWVSYKTCSGCSEVEVPILLCIACVVRADMEHIGLGDGRRVPVAAVCIGFLTSDDYVWHWWGLCGDCFTALDLPANVLQKAQRIPERLLCPVVAATRFPEFFVTEFDVLQPTRI